MFKKWYAKLFVVFSSVALLAACSANKQPQADQPKKPLTVVEVLQKADEAMKKAKGYSVHLTGSEKIGMNTPDVPFHNLEVAFDMDLESDAKGEVGHIEGNMSVFGMKMPIHMYVDKTELYQEVNKKWIKYPELAEAEMMQPAPNKDPMDELELYLTIQKEAPQALKMKEEKDIYVIEMDSKAIPEKVQQKLMDKLLKEIDGAPLPEDPKNQPALKLLQFSEKMAFDKKTFLLKNTTVNGKIEITDPETKDKATIELKFDMKLNKVLDQPVAVPADVKKNAKDFDKLSDKEKEELMNEMLGGLFGGLEKEMNKQ